MTIRELLDEASLTRGDSLFRVEHALAERVEKVLKLHTEDGTGFCWACEHTFPCDTIRALDGE